MIELNALVFDGLQLRLKITAEDRWKGGEKGWIDGCTLDRKGREDFKGYGYYG